MYGKTKVSGVPSDAQSKEKLAVYVYEYLVHIGAQKTANSFLQEIRWDKSISVGEPPGFLHSWWNVFWDLYSAAPERRDTHDHSSEAKAFHDYGFINSGYLNGISHPNHPVMSGPGVGGPTNSGPGMPPPLGPPGPDPSMRQRPSGPPMMAGTAGLPPGASPNPHHPSMRFHQTGVAGGYSGLPVSGGLIPPPHANLIPGGGGLPIHPIHGGPMLPHHHHPLPPGAMIGHTRHRWIGPAQQQPQSAGPSQGGGGGGPIVCSGSVGPNSSSGPGSIGPVGSCGVGGNTTGGGSGIVPSPGHPGTPTQHAPPSQQQSQHLASPIPLNNQGSCQPPDHQSLGNLPPGHPGHHASGHYMVGQPQQTPPPSSSGNACLPPEYSTRPSPHLVFNTSGGPCSNPDSGMYNSGDTSLLNGVGSAGSNNSNGGGSTPRGGGAPLPGGGMLPPPPPDYSAGGGGGMPPSGYPGADLKASPLHSGGGGGLSSADLMGLSGGGPQLLPPDYPTGGNGNGGGSFCPAGGPGPPESVMMMPPPLPSHQQHMVNVTTCQNAQPPSQYVSSSGPHSVPPSAAVSAPPSSLQSIVCGASNASPVGGPGSVQFPQEYSFSQLS